MSKVVKFDQHRGAKPNVEINGIRIETNIPLPSRETHKLGLRQVFAAMEVGHSFVYPRPNVRLATVQSRCSRAQLEYPELSGHRFSVGKNEDPETRKQGEWRVWRRK